VLLTPEGEYLTNYGDSLGVALFANLPPGNYTIYASGCSTYSYLMKSKVEYSKVSNQLFTIDARKLRDEGKLFMLSCTVLLDNAPFTNMRFSSFPLDQLDKPIAVTCTSVDGNFILYANADSYRLFFRKFYPGLTYLLIKDINLTSDASLIFNFNSSNLATLKLSIAKGYKAGLMFEGIYTAAAISGYHKYWAFVVQFNETSMNATVLATPINVQIWFFNIRPVNASSGFFDVISKPILLSPGSTIELCAGGPLSLDFALDNSVYLPGSNVTITPLFYDAFNNTVIGISTSAEYSYLISNEWIVRLINSSGYVVLEDRVPVEWWRFNSSFSVHIPKEVKPGHYTLELSINTSDVQGTISVSRAIEVAPTSAAPMSVWGVVLGQAGGIPAVANATIEARFLNGTMINSTKTNEWGFYNLTIRGLEAGTPFRLVASYESWVNDTVVLEFQPGASIRVDYTYTPGMIHTIKVELLKGWNLIGLSLKPENCTVESIFGENLTRISVIYGYENGSWLWWTPMAGGLKELKPGMGYWVYAKSNFTLTLKGTIPPRPSLNPGWNLIALTGTTSASPEEYLEGYDWTVIYGYNAYTGGWLWYVKGIGGDLKVLEPGLGYWVYIEG